MAYDEADLDENEEAAEETRDHSDEQLKKMFECWDKEVMDAQSQWAIEARICYDMVAGGGTIHENANGGQWMREAREQLKEDGVAPIEWNRVGPLVDAVNGAQIQNRHEIKFYPMEVGDASVAEVLTATAEWVSDRGKFEYEETDAFNDVLTCGLGATETRMDYEVEADGEIKKDRVDPLEMRWDPSSRKRNLLDARYIRRERAFSKDQFKDRFPEWAGQIEGGEFEEDGMSPHVTNPDDDYENDNYSGEKKRNKDEIRVREYQWYEVKTVKRVYDARTRETAELSEEQYENLIEMLGRVGADPRRIDMVSGRRRVYYRAFCADSKILDYGKIPCNSFTYHFITGKRDRNKGTFYGLVRAMIDPQRWANKWMTQILVIVNKNAKGGLMAEVDAFEDSNQAEDDWAKPDSITWLKSGAIREGKVQEKPAIKYPEGMDRMIQMAISSIRDVTGINQELLGMVDRDQPGILEAQRKEAGYAMLSMFFDSLREYRVTSGTLLLEFIQKYLSPETIVRVIGNEGQIKYVQLGMQDETAKYDIIVDEAPSGPNQKDKVWAMWVQMMPVLTRNPIPPQIWAEMVKWSPLPQSVGQKIAQMLMQAAQPSPEQQQAMQKQQQQQDAIVQAELRDTIAGAKKKEAEAQATMLEAPIKQGEQQLAAIKAAGEMRKAASEDRKTQADLVKAGYEAQEAKMGIGKEQAEIGLIQERAALTKAQRLNQIMETAISEYYALQQELTGETDLRVNT